MRQILSTFLVTAALATTACGSKNDDKLTDDQVAAASNEQPAETIGPDTRCTAASSNEAVKRELFRRAAEIRGSNATSYDRIAEFALLQMNDAAPTAPSSAEQAVECRANATLRLPPNLAVAGGRTNLSGAIGFSVGRANKGAAPVISMIDDEAITIPLATLSQKRAAAPAPAAPVAEPDPIAPTPEPAQQPDPVATAALARPSFDCRYARTQGEEAVCGNPTLAGLDQEMAARYRAAVARADPPQSRLLIFTRDRFLGYRDRCPTDACIATTYRGRMREIDDIMANRWRGRQ
jgi:hypothetical protein